MTNLSPLTGEPFSYFETIANCKYAPRGPRIRALGVFVRARYAAYQNAAKAEPRHNLAALQRSQLTSEQSQDLRHCYDVGMAALDTLKADIVRHISSASRTAGAMCQYCMLNSEPSDFDHYAPRQLYPEFSVLSLNLVPCCPRCNTLKGTAWVDENGDRCIINYYYDALPTTQFLFAEVTMESNAPVAQFRLGDATEDFGGLEKVIRNHFQRLELLERMTKAASAPISEYKEAVSDTVREDGIEAARELLMDRAGQLTRCYSSNYWEVPLLQALAASTPFLEFSAL